MTKVKTAVREMDQRLPTLGEIGLTNFVPYLMNRITGRYNANLRKDLQDLGLSTAKMRALAVLSVKDGIQIGELAVYAVVEQSTLSRALDQLTSDDLVRRAADPEDSRAVRLYITEKGAGAFELLWPIMAQSYLNMFDGIPEAEKFAFVATLQKILANIKENDF